MNQPIRIGVIIPTLDRPWLLARCLQSLKQSVPGIFVVPIVMQDDPRLDYVARTNEALAKFTDYDGMIYGTDDVEFAPQCVREAATAMIDRFPGWDGLIGLRQDHGGIHSAWGLIGRAFIERFPGREVMCPDYVHYFADYELGVYAERIGKFYHCPEARIHHERAMDVTYQIAQNTMNEDGRTNSIRIARGFLWGESFDRVNER